MLTLVTGASGFLGNNVVRMLCERGDAVRVLVREQGSLRSLENLDVEVHYGDVRHPREVRAAVEGVSHVIHAAGYIHFGRTHLEQSRAINVGGTCHVADAVQAVGATLVHVSSVDALGVGLPHQLADEETQFGDKAACVYVVTKREAERSVLLRVEKGLSAVIVNPVFMMGPWDWKPSSGRMLLALAKKFTPLAPRGGLTMCDVRDVATGILTARTQGRIGERYILGGQCMTYYELWRLLARVCGAQPPWCRAGPRTAKFCGLWGDLWGWWSGEEPEINSLAVRLTSQYHYYSSDKAIAQLGYVYRPAEQAAQAAWDWLCRQGYA